MPRKRKPLSERFWPKVSKAPHPKGCWEWTAYVNPNGYGNISAGGYGSRALLSHRVSWQLANGKIPKGLHVLHHCDNPKCVNPKHLFLGTAKTNCDDKMRKGRHRHGPGKKGEEHPMAVLKPKIVKEIRRLYSSGIYTHRSLGSIFSVSPSTIGTVTRREHWRDVP